MITTKRAYRPLKLAPSIDTVKGEYLYSKWVDKKYSGSYNTNYSHGLTLSGIDCVRLPPDCTSFSEILDLQAHQIAAKHNCN